MAVDHGLKGVLKSGTNTIGQLQNIKSGTKAELASKAVMGDTFDTFLVGLKSGQGSADCLYDPADTLGQEALVEGAAVTLNILPQGSGTGKRQLSVPALVESVDLDVAMNGPVKRSFTWRMNSSTGPTWSTL